MPDDDAPAEGGGDLTARLKQLEERIETDAPAPTRRRRTPVPPVEPLVLPPLEDEGVVWREPGPDAPAKKAAAKKAPAKRAPKKVPPIATPVTKKAAPKKAPAKAATPPPVQPAAPPKAPPGRRTKVADLGDSPATPWPVTPPPPVPPAAPPRAPAATPRAPAVRAPSPTQPPLVAAVPREKDPVVRVLVVLAVLLLAAAAALGAAALVQHRDSTYRADVTLRVDPGPAPASPVEDTLAAGVPAAVERASGHAFTLTAAQRAGIANDDLQGDIKARQWAPRQIRLDVFAATAAEAKRLATAAGDAFVEEENIQEAVHQPSAGDRLTVAVVAGPDAVTKTAPDDQRLWTAAGLAAAVVLAVAGLAALVTRLTRRS